MKPLADLLSHRLKDPTFRRQVLAAQTVEAANDWLESVLPPSRREDACAMSLREGHVIVACTTSAAAEFLSDRTEEALTFICRRVPSAAVLGLRMRLASEIFSHEF